MMLVYLVFVLHIVLLLFLFINNQTLEIKYYRFKSHIYYVGPLVICDGYHFLCTPSVHKLLSHLIFLVTFDH
jgi:hypothetical protein